MSVSHLRPLSFGEILDGAFALYRRNFVVFVTTALVPLLPGVLLLAVLGFWVQGENLTPSDFNLMMAAALLVLLAGSLLGWGALVH
ncbi:MAG TPA: hypothetical protein VFQ76_18850, partial [Longimicrobiaceae bacterium]|nr:hypothetical protein [Longimicrobiaceae bacterium]